MLHRQQADLRGVRRYREAKVYAALAAAADAAVAVATNTHVCVAMFNSVEDLVDQGIHYVRTARSTSLPLLCACLHIMKC